jgi:DNA-binding transcriptional ArsR family regulator
MSEKPETEIGKLLLEDPILEAAEITDPKLKLIDKAIQDFAPEVAFLYQIREDESEEQQIKTGRLHENRILGIFLKYYLEGKNRIATGEVEEEYKRYFKEIARSTTSTYLNMLKKEFILHTEREGRIVYYSFKEDPPKGLKSFWFTRIFCIVPVYFDRAMKFSNLYINAENHVQEYVNEYNQGNKEILVRNFKFITGLIMLNIFKNRCSKCVGCQFSKREIYKKLEETIHIAIKDRSDVLPAELLIDLIEKFSEVPVFNGIDIKEDIVKGNIVKAIAKHADIYRKDLEFQFMVSDRRKASRLKQLEALEEDSENLSS